jgi:cobalt-zinc-cadmium efflux system membrane fusion protein
MLVGPKGSAVPIDMSLGWCAGHGVPESVCTRCNASLIPTFKEAGDWCGGHNLPESQCLSCNPQVRDEWAALGPKPKEVSPPEPSTIETDRPVRQLTATNDPLCTVDTLRVRFLDPSIIRKAGIHVEPAQRTRMSAVLEVPAEVQFDPTRLTRVTPRAPGVVRETPIQLGDTVKAGDLLAVIDSPVLGQTKSRYIELQQNHRLAAVDLNRLQAIHKGVRRMLEVSTVDAAPEAILKELKDVPLGEPKAKLLRAHASLQLARTEAARETQLAEKSISSERNRQAAQSKLAAAEADFMAIREEIAFNSERDQLAAERSETVAKSEWDATRRQLHILGLTVEQIDTIGTEGDDQLSRFELRSPAAGRVVERHVAPGESVEETAVLFVIVDTSAMWMMAHVDAARLTQLREDLPVLLTVDGMKGASFEGRLNWISSRVDDRSRTIQLRAELPNPDGLLRDNMFGQARIVLHENEEVLSVPGSAVQTDGCCQLVFVQESDTVFQPKKVFLGAEANGRVEVLKGLTDGERIAATGSFLMKTEILKGNIGAGCCEVEPGR